MTDPMRAPVHGWGPDFSEIEIQCPEPECWWKRLWEDDVPLGEIVQAITEHVRSEHP